MIKISKSISLPEGELNFSAIRSSGPGGQNVNKVATAVQLSFDIHGSSLPEEIKDRMKCLRDRRISKQGLVIIKAARYRSQEKNKQDAVNRFTNLVKKALIRQKKRVPTRPTRASKTRRLEEKSVRSKIKSLRGKVMNQGES